MNRIRFAALVFFAVATVGFAQDEKPVLAPPKTVEDPNKQQVVPKLEAIPKPDKGYGTIVGQFIFDGKIPEKVLLHKKGSPDAKDAATCAARDQFRNDLIINEKNQGVRNIFVYEKAGTYSKKKDAIHPKLRKPKQPFLWFDQQGCRFYPKTLLVQVPSGGEIAEVRVVSNDPVNHNTRSAPLRNQPANVTIGQNDREGIPFEFKSAETVPVEVKCDLHPWMKAHWLVMDHPYMAVSNADGRFMIQNLPEGKHELRLWHGTGFYLHRKIKEAKGPGYEIVTTRKKRSNGKYREDTKMFLNVVGGEIIDMKQIKLKAEWFEDK